MNFSAHNKDVLQSIADKLEIEVEAKKEGKPTKDELVAGLEEFEKEDPEMLKSAVEELGIEDKEAKEDDEVDAPVGKGQTFTYVGAGEESPSRINFMQRQEFVRGRETVVTDKELIRKITGNPTFVKGKATPEQLQAIEDEGNAISNANRKADKRMNAQFHKQHGGE